MRHAGSNPFRSRRPLRSILFGAALIGVIVLAAIGALLGLALLAIGALVHAVIKALRKPAAKPASAGRVIEGEFVVVSGPHGATTPRPGVSRAH
jgi:hypothetical protein